MSPAGTVLSSKPAARCCSGGWMGETDGQTDGRTDVVALHRPGSAYHASSVNYTVGLKRWAVSTLRMGLGPSCCITGYSAIFRGLVQYIVNVMKPRIDCCIVILHGHLYYNKLY